MAACVYDPSLCLEYSVVSRCLSGLNRFRWVDCHRRLANQADWFSCLYENVVLVLSSSTSSSSSLTLAIRALSSRVVATTWLISSKRRTPSHPFRNTLLSWSSFYSFLHFHLDIIPLLLTLKTPSPMCLTWRTANVSTSWWTGKTFFLGFLFYYGVGFCFDMRVLDVTAVSCYLFSRSCCRYFILKKKNKKRVAFLYLLRHGIPAAGCGRKNGWQHSFISFLLFLSICDVSLTIF